MKKNGFTLIELLVVIAVIALLMSILVPVLNIAKSHARTVICNSNLRQWYLCAQTYAANNNDSIWEGFNYENPNIKSNWWVSALRKYYDDIDKIRCCPTATKTENDIDGNPTDARLPFRAWGYDKPLFETEDYGSYGINGWILNPRKNKNMGRDPSYFWRRVTKIKQADRVPFMLDAQWIDAWPEPGSPPPDPVDETWREDGNSKISQMKRVCQDRHRGYENCVFMDGSARKVGLKELWRFKWYSSFNINGTWTSENPNAKWPTWMASLKDY